MKKSNATKKGLKKEKTDRKTMWMSIILLAIMLLSIGGFALMSGGGGSSPNKPPSEFPLQQIEHEGQLFWYAIRNNEQFIFENVQGYESSLIEKGLASKIKEQDIVSIYVDEGFTDSNSLFLVEKALTGIQKPFSKSNENECENNSLVFTNNESFQGECMKFVSSNEEAYSKAQILVYHLIKE